METRAFQSIWRAKVRLGRKARWFWPLAIALLVADCATKRVVEDRLTIGETRPVVGDVVRLTLSYNNAAAMGISLGGNSRVVLTTMSLLALMVLAVLYHRTRASERLRTIAVALVIGGALGNLLDRIRSTTGVVDFIDVGVADVRFWTFNVADIGITIGALLLLVAMGRWNTSSAQVPRPQKTQ
jgi:signal peptidase II